MALNEDEKAELVAYLDGELDEAATQAVEAKIAGDPDTRAELDALKQTWGMLDFLPKASPSPNFTNRTMERLTLEDLPASKTMPMPRQYPGWVIAATWAAVVLLAIGGGYWASTYFWPSLDAVPDADVPLVQHLRIAEQWRLYEFTDDVDFARKLEHPDLFGDEDSL
jgi:anti-sigma factor RsiW